MTPVVQYNTYECEGNKAEVDLDADCIAKQAFVFSMISISKPDKFCLLWINLSQSQIDASHLHALLDCLATLYSNLRDRNFDIYHITS
jgi:hypothetical protein